MTTALEPTPIHDFVLAKLGPLYDNVDTEFVVLESMAVCAMVERAP